MPTSPVPIDALPTPPSQGDPTDFETRADAFLTALTDPFVDQVNTAASATYDNAVEAVAAATTASTAADNAADAAATASGAAYSAVNAPGTSTTSTTSAAIGTGAKTLTVQTNKLFVAGMWVVAADTAAPSTNYMIGQVTAYNSATGVLDFTVPSTISAVGGSGTKTAWTVSLTAAPGADGATGSPGSGASLSGTNTWTAKQTFSAGADVTPETTPTTTAVGYLGSPQNGQTANYTLVMADAGKTIRFTATGKTLTIPANASVAFPIGTVIVVDITTGSLSVAITTDTLRWIPGNSTGSRTVTAPGTLTLRKVAATEWWCFGLNVS